MLLARTEFFNVVNKNWVFDAANENWGFDIASENWVLNKLPWPLIMDLNSIDKIVFPWI